MGLKGKTAFVTGSGGGIGRAICLALAKAGVKTVLFGGNNKKNLLETKRQVEDLGGNAEIFSGNLTDEKVLDQTFCEAVKKTGGIDILINNAGIAMHAPFEETTPKMFDDIMTLNAKVPFFLCQKALPYLRESDHATIINIASVVAHQGYPMQSVYTASKHALLGITKSLASEVYKDGIRVHAICPGGVYTDMIKLTRPDLTPDGMIMPEEIANIVTFLLENRGNAVIDEIIVHRLNKEPFLV